MLLKNKNFLEKWQPRRGGCHWVYLLQLLLLLMWEYLGNSVPVPFYYSNLPAGKSSKPLEPKLFPGNTPLSGVQPSGKLE